MKLRLTLDVEYDTKGLPRRYFVNRLEGMVQAAISDGGLTGESEAEVETYSVIVEEMK